MQRFRAGDLSFTAPESWAEVTLSQFLTLNAPDAPTDPRFIITTLSGLPESDFRDKKAPFDLSAFVLEHLGYVWDMPNVPESLPKTIILNDKTIVLPSDIGEVATVGQMWDVELMVKERQKEELPVDPASLADVLLSVYLWPMLRTDPYVDRYQAVEELWPILSKLPCIDGLATAGFFLRSSLQPSSSGKVSVSRLPPTPTKIWPRLVSKVLHRFKTTSSLSS